jgi:hypothetical protein
VSKLRYIWLAEPLSLGIMGAAAVSVCCTTIMPQCNEVRRAADGDVGRPLTSGA